MDSETATEPKVSSAAPVAIPSPVSSLHPTATIAALAAATSTLEACGGGGGDSAAPAAAPTPAPPAPTAAEAARFLAQASMGASRAHIASVQALGYSGWLDAQFALPASATRWDWLVAAGYTDPSHKNDEAGFDSATWAKLLGAPDTLRQRLTLAYSEIFVAAIDGLVGSGWRQFSAATYLDLLEANAFGNHRTLLQQISLSAPMGQFLTFRGSAKANTTTGALPDENYARELMQLFTLGLVQLNLDGTPMLTNGATTYTYGQTDVTGLARVFTGWDFDLGGQTAAVATATPDFIRKPMVQITGRYETGAKAFLGTTIAAGVDAPTALTQALDAIFAHPNVAPFFSRQLIQRLVTSNPSAAYVTRVATVFNNNGSGGGGSTKGDLKAVIKAVLLDDEARSASAAAATGFGKLREPILRFTGWARAYSVASATNAWAIGDTSNPGTRLAQSPLRSPSVFNFFRPGYVPPNTGFDATAMVAPEFQIANESSVVGYLNFMQAAVAGKTVGDVVADYTTLLAVADDANALLTEINLVLAAGRLSAATLAPLATAVNSMASGSDATRRNRIGAALVLVLAAPEFLVQK